MKKKTQGAPAPNYVKWLWYAALTPFVLLAAMLTLTALGAFGRMPSFEELENPRSNIATEIYSEDGKVLGTFFVQNRSYVQYEELFASDSVTRTSINGREVPPIVAALIATEDARFDSHSGIDIPSLIRVGVKTILLQNRSAGGGSTITQQLAKNLFPRDTVRRQSALLRKGKLVLAKFKEWITALKLEYNYTKEEIAAMYLNIVEYGSNAYGIKSAAHTFFNKTPDQLNLQEAAVLVGVVNAPTRYSPVRNYDNAMARRNLVLARMAEAGAITHAERDSLSALPITLNYRPVSHNDGQATYFREMLRQVMNARPPKRRNFYTEWDYEQAVKEYENNPIYGWCHKNTKADGTPYNIYKDGLKIYTTINSTMQQYAEEAMLKQLRTVIQPKMDAQYRSTKVLFQNTSAEEREKIVRQAMRYSDRYRALKEEGRSEAEIDRIFRTPCPTRVFTYRGERDTILSPRDSILHHKRIMRAGFVAIEPQTGRVKAYVGGPNFRYFKYDMAKQGKRQIGSTIKPFVYTFAIDHLGLTPCTPVPNLPVTIDTSNGTPWSPKEASKVVYDGEMHPLKWGLARSRNNYSAWIMKQAKQPEAVADFIHNMGIRSFIDPVYALCLGTSESSVFEMVSAYSTFANGGVHTAPIFVTRIEARQGSLIAAFVPDSQAAVSERTAYTMLTMLQSVVTNGTAGRLKWQFDLGDAQLGGKTGTSQRNRDAWFMCVAPKLVAGAWVGGEDQSVHPTYGGEGSIMALPIVGEFFSTVYKNPALGISKQDRFRRPDRVTEYDCEEEMQQSQYTEEEEGFFD